MGRGIGAGTFTTKLGKLLYQRVPVLQVRFGERGGLVGELTAKPDGFVIQGEIL